MLFFQDIDNLQNELKTALQIRRFYLFHVVIFPVVCMLISTIKQNEVCHCVFLIPSGFALILLLASLNPRLGDFVKRLTVILAATFNFILMGVAYRNDFQGLPIFFLSMYTVMGALLYTEAGRLLRYTIISFGVVWSSVLLSNFSEDVIGKVGLYSIVLLLVYYILDQRLKTLSGFSKSLELLSIKKQETVDMLDSFSAMICFKDLNNNLIRVNDAFAAAMGLSRAEVEGRNLAELIDEEAAAFYFEDDMRIVSSGVSELGKVEEMPAHDGSIKWVRSDKRLYKDAAGKVIGISFYGVDITEQILAEEALLEKESRFRAIFDLAPIGILLADQDFIVQNTNAEAHKITKQFSLDTNQFNLRKLSKYLTQGDVASVRALFDGQERSTAFEASFKRQDGQELTFDISVVAFQKTAHTKNYIIIINDKTEEKLSEDKLKQYATNLEASNKTLEEFAYVASHDMREPLRTISSYAQLLEKRYAPNLDEDGRQFIKFITDAGKRLDTYILGLLEYSRVGRYKPNRTLAKLNDLVFTVKELLSVQINENQATVVVGELPETQVVVHEMRALFQNLISNAIKYRSSAEPLIEISCQDFSTHWGFTIKDNGRGVEDIHLARVFDVFYRANYTQTTDGTGIGLAICKKIVQHHGGEITMQNNSDGVGVTVRFTLEKTA